MYFKGFKIAVSINFLILLCIGMILTNIVVTFLWQQHVVNLSVNNSRAYLNLVNLTKDSFCGRSGVGTIYEAISRTLPAESVISFIILSDHEMYVGDKPIGSDLQTVLQHADQLKSSVLAPSGNYLSILGLSARDVTIAVPVEDCDTMEAIGAVVHIPGIVQAIRKKQSLILVYILVKYRNQYTIQ